MSAPQTGSFAHEALLYTTPGQMIDWAIPFVQAGVEADEPVLVAVPPASLEPIRSALGDLAARVRFLDMSEEGRNPGRIIPGVMHAFVSRHTPKRVRIVGEHIWPGRSAAEYPACVQHEALVNLAFADCDAIVMCPYDARRLTVAALADAERTHPVVVSDGGRRVSTAYADPHGVVAAFNRPLAAPCTPPATFVFDADDLPAVRRFVAEHAGRAGLAANRIADLEVSVNEVATNAVIHGGGPGTLRVWPERGSVLCEVSDPGHLTDPLAGRIPPGPDREHGRGLLLVNYLCDLVRVHTAAAAGTTVRMHMQI